MSDSAPPYSELLSLFIALLDESISDADFARLDATLANDPQARAFYLEFMRTSAMLEQRAESQAQADAHEVDDHEDDLSFLGLEETQPLAPGLTFKDAEQLLAPPLEDAVLVDLTDELARRDLAAKEKTRAARRVAHINRTQASPGSSSAFVVPKPLVWLGLAAMVGLAVWVVNILTPPAVAPPPTAQNPPASTPDRTADPVAAATTVAHLGGQIDAQWADGRARRAGTPLVVGQTLELTTGFVELTTPQGTTVTLEGPCELEAVAEGRLALHRGRLSAERRSATSPMTIQTPGGEVAYQVAGFGLEVEGDRATRVVVYAGQVDLFGQGGRATTPDPFQLTAGRMAFAQGGDLASPTISRSSVSDSLSFARSLEDAGSWDFQYRRAVLDSSPVAYWTFGGGGQRDALASQAAGGERLRLVGGARLASRDGRHWLDINPSGPASSYAELISGYSELAGAEAYTVECWVRPREWNEAALVSLSVERLRQAFDAPSAMVLHLHDPNQPGVGRRTLRFVHRNPPAIQGPSQAVDDTVYPTDQWLHLAAVKTRDELRVYVNGRLVAAQPDRTPMTEEPLRLLLGYHYTGDDSSRQFSGALDEIAFYRHALTEAELAAHYDAAGPMD